MSRRIVVASEQKCMLSHVLSVGWAAKPPIVVIDANMQDLIDSGLSRYLVHTVMQTQDGASFLAAADALLTREKVIRSAAKELWNAAAMRFYETPPGYVASREAFVRVMNAYTLTLPRAWGSVLNQFDVEDVAKFMRRVVSGDRFFWVFDWGPAWLVSCMIAASLETTTQSGAAAKLALKIKLAATVGQLASARDDAALDTLAASLKDSVYAADFDPFAATLVRRFADPWVRMGTPPTFEAAEEQADSKGMWKDFINEITGMSTHRMYLYLS